MKNLFSVNYDLGESLSFDVFQGDFGHGDERTFENKIVTARKDHDCFHCDTAISKGEKYRKMVEKSGDELRTFKWCSLCCVAMILDDKNGGYSFDQRCNTY